VTDTMKRSLSDMKLVSGLTEEQRAPIEKACRWLRFTNQEQIIDKQSGAREIFFIVEGSVRIVNYSLSGREVTLDDLGPGNHFGDLAAIDGEPRSASVMALSDCLLAALPHDHLLGAMERHWSIAFAVMGSLTRIVRASTDRIMDLSTLGANNRVHAEILRRARESDAGDNTATITPIPVHSDIASRVSTTRETVARVLNDLARQSLVARTKESLVIQDLDRLERMVEYVRGE